MWWLITMIGFSAYIGLYGIIPIIITSVVIGVINAIMASTTYEIGSLLCTSRLKEANRLLLLISRTARFRIVSKDDTTHIIQISTLGLWLWIDVEVFYELSRAKGVIHTFYNQIDEAQAKMRMKKRITNVTREDFR